MARPSIFVTIEPLGQQGRKGIHQCRFPFLGLMTSETWYELRQMRHAFAGIAVALGKAGAGDLQALTGGASVALMTLHAGAEGGV